MTLHDSDTVMTHGAPRHGALLTLAATSVSRSSVSSVGAGLECPSQPEVRDGEQCPLQRL